MATMFQRFGKDMKLCDTYRKRDIDIKHDYVNPAASDESNELMVSFNRAPRLRLYAPVTGVKEHLLIQF